MPPPYWGVDSFNPITVTRRWDGGRAMSLFDFVRSKMDGLPTFWGRYLNNAKPSRITRGECEALKRLCASHGATVRLLLVYNDITLADCQLAGQAGYQRGGVAAASACRLARGLGITGGVRLYADLEGWPASPEWMRGWWDTMQRSEFAGIGGFYGRGVERLNRRGAGRLRIRDVTAEDGRRQPPLVASAGRRFLRSGWSARVPTAIDQQLGPWVIDPAREGRLHESPPQLYVWSNMPRMDRRTPPPTPAEFRGVGPVGARVAVWQYCFGLFRPPPRADGTRRPAAFDLDLATAAGFNEMWQGL